MLKRWVAGLVLVATTVTTIPVYAEPAESANPAPAAPTVPTATDKTPSLLPELKSDQEPDRLSGKYFLGYLADTGKLVSAPLHFDSGDWLKVGLVGGVTGSLFLIDSKVKSFAQSHQSGVADKFATVGNDLGTPLYTLPPVGAFYLYGLMKDDAKARKTSLLALESFVISGVFTNGIKMLVQRHRPNTGDAPGTVDGPKLSLKNLSFSSGHTASAFSIATVFAEQYKDNPFVPPIAYSLATLTGLSRIYSNAHWSSDVFFGAALGYFVSRGVLSFHKEKPDQNKLTIVPAVSKDMTGLTLQGRF